MIPTPKPKWTEASIYKLYVSPVTNFDKISLKETFSQYAEIADVYISEPNDTGFKWAFVYFASEQGLKDAVTKLYENNEYNFKLSRAKPKVFQTPGPAPAPAPADTSFGANMMNGIAKPNGVPYTAPPNCVFCRKLTFSICVSCKNPFCSKECTLDGWRAHTGLCVKIAELVRIPESTNGMVGNALAPTVVNFMKGCQYTKKKFTSNEFADACNYRSKVNIPPATVPKKEEYDNVPLPNKQPMSQDKGRRMAASLPKQSSPDLDQEDPWGLTEDKQPAKTFKPQIKRNPDPTRNPAPTRNPPIRNPAPIRKPNRKCMSENGDAEETKARTPHQEKYQRNSDSDGEGSIVARSVNDYRTDDKRVDFRKKSNESKRPVRSKEVRAAPVARTPPETDLKLEPGAACEVVVTSIVNTNTFFVANPKSVTAVLREILDCAERTPQLQNAELNALCLASFEREWYRARILSTNPIEVEYIDYGNRDTCEIENLKVLPVSLKKYLPLATKVQLKEGLVKLFNIEENEEKDIFVDSYDPSSGTWIVDVLE